MSQRPIRPTHRFPGGARFAFTILDDTDDSTLENARPVYDRLQQLGFRTTKTAWPLDCPEGSKNFFAADTLERSDYLEWTQALVEAGFELALHGATMESSPRERTQRGFDFLERNFGNVPRIHANHGFNRESVYWGAERFATPWLRSLVARFGGEGAGFFQGQTEGSEYYWGDLCAQHVEYVRGFTSTRLNIEDFDPCTPYRRPDTPCVQFWFSTADAPDAKAFKQRVTTAALDALEEANGICILSSHLGKGFAKDGRLDPEIDATLTDLASRNGWFAPVGSILDFMRSEKQSPEPLTPAALRNLELRFCRLKVVERLSDRAGSR